MTLTQATRAMTRKEQIKEQLKELPKDTFDSVADYVTYCAGFYDGVAWADKTMIEKACEFLKTANAAQAIVIRKGVYNMHEFSVIEFTENFVEQFRKAMQDD